MKNTIDKFTMAYVSIINEMNGIKPKKRLIKEQADEALYDLTISVPDNRINDEEFFDEEDDFDDKKLDETVKDTDWYKMLTKLGGKVSENGHDSGEGTSQNAGDWNYFVHFTGLTKQQVFDLMHKEVNRTSIFLMILEGFAENSYLDEAFADPDKMIEILLEANDEGWYGIEIENTNGADSTSTYRIELALVDADQVAADDGYETFDEAKAKIEKDINFLKKFGGYALDEFSTPGGHGWIYEFFVKKADLKEFLSYELIGDADGIIFLMTDTAYDKTDIADKSNDEIIEMLEEEGNNSIGFDGHHIFEPATEVKSDESDLDVNYCDFDMLKEELD